MKAIIINNKINFFLMIFSILLLLKFWIGIFSHDEFKGHHLFIKHRPIWKTYFYSPRGMSDLKLSEMSKEKKHEQTLFNEFIIRNQNL
ncbi:hypothetical protein [Winogradskyella sp. 4-2091]|uniref:hypothetical protein n=1 Tax=Winogradskyella sp. 4-2091 TaxID=3381659 RepID=UPI0038920BE9